MCKFTPLGFETGKSFSKREISHRVNLPRWGLKRMEVEGESMTPMRVNLPRWGLKRTMFGLFLANSWCKFTPLGFETE